MPLIARLLIALTLLLPLPAQAVWREAKTRHFVIYSEGSEASLREFATKVERFDTLLRQRYNVSDADEPQRLTIFMLPNQAAVNKLLPGKAAGVAGFYRPRASGSVAVVHRNKLSGKFNLDGDTLLFHEYAHHFIIRNFPGAYPAWFSEGFAEFISTTDFTKEGNAKLGMPPYYRAFGLMAASSIPVKRLLTGTTSEFAGSLRDTFYGRSWLLVHMLSFEKARAGQLNRYIAAINDGTPNLDAATAAFGDLEILEKDLRAYLAKSKLSYVMQAQPTPAPDRIDIATLAPGASALVPHRLAMMLGPQEEALPGVIAALRGVIAKHPQEADAHRLLGEAEFEADNDVAAEAAADAALAIDPKLPRAMLLKGRAQLRRHIRASTVSDEQWKTARGWIVRANRADTNDPLPLLAYYSSWRAQGIAPNAVSFDGLRRAHEMVPEDVNVRMTLAFALANQKQYDRAIRLVETVAYAPHEDGGTERARSILKDMRARKAAGGAPVEVPDLID